jgi:hypothetical protein
MRNQNAPRGSPVAGTVRTAPEERTASPSRSGVQKKKSTLVTKKILWKLRKLTLTDLGRGPPGIIWQWIVPYCNTTPQGPSKWVLLFLMIIMIYKIIQLQGLVGGNHNTTTVMTNPHQVLITKKRWKISLYRTSKTTTSNPFQSLNGATNPAVFVVHLTPLEKTQPWRRALTLGNACMTSLADCIDYLSIIKRFIGRWRLWLTCRHWMLISGVIIL